MRRRASSTLADGPTHRLRPGRRGQHRRLRPARRDRRRRAGARTRGCTSTAPSGCGRPPHRASATSSQGAERADSWAVDAHKWLNVPYDGGLAIVADRAALNAAMGVTASYLPEESGPRADRPRPGVLAPRPRDDRSTPRCAQLGRAGIAELVERNCALARRLADGHARARGRRGAQRRRPQPGAGALRRRRRDARAVVAAVQRERRGVAGRHGMARSRRHPRLGLELVDHRETTSIRLAAALKAARS